MTQKSLIRTFVLASQVFSKFSQKLGRFYSKKVRCYLYTERIYEAVFKSQSLLNFQRDA